MAMTFADLALSQRLERAEGDACAQYAAARRRLFPESGAEWISCAGGFAVFDGPDSVVTQAFGLGLIEPLSASILDSLEDFFLSRGAPVDLEISPLAGVAALDLLCARGYRPIEVSSVMMQPVAPVQAPAREDVRVRVIEADEGARWSDVSTRGWTHDHPELRDFLESIATIATARERSVCFLAEFEGTPGAAGVLCMHEGVAVFGGSTTVPELRRRGLQAALLHERMRYAHDHGCDLAMMVAGPGSDSQRNAERTGFRIAYTRIKWRLPASPPARQP
jgi:GNAT superfamily N-acetyltransferase